jgi:hypothetical protein
MMLRISSAKNLKQDIFLLKIFSNFPDSFSNVAQVLSILEGVLDQCDEETLKFCFDIYFSLSSKLIHQKGEEGEILGMPLSLIKKMAFEIGSKGDKVSIDIILVLGRCISHVAKISNSNRTFKQITDDFLPFFLKVSIYCLDHHQNSEQFIHLILSQLENMLSEFPKEAYFGIFNFFKLQANSDTSTKQVNTLRLIFCNEKYNILDILFKEINKSLRAWIKEDIK